MSYRIEIDEKFYRLDCSTGYYMATPEAMAQFPDRETARARMLDIHKPDCRDWRDNLLLLDELDATPTIVLQIKAADCTPLHREYMS